MNDDENEVSNTVDPTCKNDSKSRNSPYLKNRLARRVKDDTGTAQVAAKSVT